MCVCVCDVYWVLNSENENNIDRESDNVFEKKKYKPKKPLIKTNRFLKQKITLRI